MMLALPPMILSVKKGREGMSLTSVENGLLLAGGLLAVELLLMWLFVHETVTRTDRMAVLFWTAFTLAVGNGAFASLIEPHAVSRIPMWIVSVAFGLIAAASLVTICTHLDRIGPAK